MSTTPPLVSIIMPTYNYGRYVTDAIESIQAQTFGNFEIVVVDDGSTDDTTAILARLAEPRLRVLRQEHAGTARSRNRGLDAARGAFITWLDADDLWKPTFLERHLAVLEAEPEVGYSFANFMRSKDGEPLPGTQFDLVPRLRELPTRAARGGLGRVVEMDAFAALAPSTSLPGWLQASVFRRAALEGRRCDPRIKAAEDLFLLLQVYAGGTRIAFLDDVLVEVRRHGQNSYANGEQMQHAVLETILAVDADIPLTPSQQAILHRRIAAEYSALGWRHFWQHDAGKAASYYGHALRWPGQRLNALAHLAIIPLLPMLPRREPGF